MDDFARYLAPLQRRYKFQPAVHSTAHIPHKTGWVDGTFPTTNFSFILSGCGQYTCSDGTWNVVAPCVLTQWPGDHFYYGPDSEWEEFYICFEGESYQKFLESGLMDINRRVWPITNMRQFMSKLKNFISSFDRKQSTGWVDRIDLAAQEVVLESLLGEPDIQDETERAVNLIRDNVEINYLSDHDFDELALDAGMSPSSFRRYWQKIVELPPRKYVIRLRINRAQRYLVETNLCIAKIASLVGFEDQFYFARKFKQFIGMTPSKYRKNNIMLR